MREIWTSTQMNDWFAHEWAGIAQVFMIRRTVKEKGQERVEVMYGMTNLPRKKANAERLLKLNRKHWWIENRLDEGATWVRQDHLKGNRANTQAAALAFAISTRSEKQGREHLR